VQTSNPVHYTQTLQTRKQKGHVMSIYELTQQLRDEAQNVRKAALDLKKSMEDLENADLPGMARQLVNLKMEEINAGK
jgi:hypothetical protein